MEINKMFTDALSGSAGLTGFKVEKKAPESLETVKLPVTEDQATLSTTRPETEMSYKKLLEGQKKAPIQEKIVVIDESPGKSKETTGSSNIDMRDRVYEKETKPAVTVQEDKDSHQLTISRNDGSGNPMTLAVIDDISITVPKTEEKSGGFNFAKAFGISDKPETDKSNLHKKIFTIEADTSPDKFKGGWNIGASYTDQANGTHREPSALGVNLNKYFTESDQKGPNLATDSKGFPGWVSTDFKKIDRAPGETMAELKQQIGDNKATIVTKKVADGTLTAIQDMAKEKGKNHTRYDMSQVSNGAELFGHYGINAAKEIKEDEPTFKWQDSLLVTNMKKGGIAVIEDANNLPVMDRKEITKAINDIAEKGTLDLNDRGGGMVKAHPDFQLVLVVPEPEPGPVPGKLTFDEMVEKSIARNTDKKTGEINSRAVFTELFD